MKKCTICDSKVENELNICPHCGHDFGFDAKEYEAKKKSQREKELNKAGFSEFEKMQIELYGDKYPMYEYLHSKNTSNTEKKKYIKNKVIIPYGLIILLLIFFNSFSFQLFNISKWYIGLFCSLFCFVLGIIIGIIINKKVEETKKNKPKTLTFLLVFLAGIINCSAPLIRIYTLHSTISSFVFVISVIIMFILLGCPIGMYIIREFNKNIKE